MALLLHIPLYQAEAHTLARVNKFFQSKEIKDEMERQKIPMEFAAKLAESTNKTIASSIGALIKSLPRSR